MINFDNLLWSLLTLFTVTTLEGWHEVSDGLVGRVASWWGGVYRVVWALVSAGDTEGSFEVPTFLEIQPAGSVRVSSSTNSVWSLI